MYPKQLIRYISGDYTPEDEHFVQEWVQEEPMRKETLNELQKTWELKGTLELGDEERAWNNLRYRIEKQKQSEKVRLRSIKRKRKRGRRDYEGANMFLKVAAILLVVAGIAIYMYSLSSYSVTESEANKTVYHTITSERGEQVHFRFKDGTKVVLNAESQLRYSNTYGDSTRDLQLTGEAYFKVNHDHPIPLVVYARSARIEDIGTEFNVTAYPEQQATEVIVADGKVKVSPHKQNSGLNTNTITNGDNELPFVILSQNEGVRVKEGTNANELQVTKADLNKKLGWLEDRLIFDGEPLAHVINRLERRYKIEVEVEDPSLLEKRITASFIDESVENIAILLAESMEASYSYENSTIRFFTKQEINKNNKK